MLLSVAVLLDRTVVRERIEGSVPSHGARRTSSVKSRRVRLVAVALLLVVFWAGFFVRDASFVLSVFGRFAGSPYVLGFTMFPLWSLAALVAALVLLLSLLVDARMWPIWIVAAVLVGALLLLRGLRFSVFVPEAAHRQFKMVDYLLWPGTLWVKWWALLAIGLVLAGTALVAFVLPGLRRSPWTVKAG